MKKQVFVSGIGTGIGKTFCSALLVKLWQADYWKPIQSGDLDMTDSMMVQELVEDEVTIFPERYRLNSAASPHESARIDGVEIKLNDFQLPYSPNNLVVEGAGGLYVPINEDKFIIDLIKHLNLPVVLVVKDYLGCINHSILSIKALESNNIVLDTVVFNGPFSNATERVIRRHLPEEVACLNIPWLHK